MQKAPGAEIVYRHNRITRTTHWINAVALMVLFMSGLQIFNAFPELHWGDKAEPEQALVSVRAADNDGEPRGYTTVLGYRIDTTGFLGLQFTDNGPAARAFPSWITIPGFFWLAGGRRWHFFFGWLFVLNGLLYFVYNALNGHMRKFLASARSIAQAPAMALYYVRIRRHPPEYEEYNPLQQIAYTSVFLILTPLVLLSGLALSPQLDIAFHWLPAAFGGRQAARTVHFVLAFGFLFFTAGHIFMVLTTGVLNNMRSIVTGWYRQKLPSEAAPTPLPAEPAPIAASVATSPAADDTPARVEVSPQPVAITASTDQKPPAACEPSSDVGGTVEEVKTHGEK
jgi:Ni/Fe-hydrogenase b-type cytochrome subunit